MLSCPCGRPYLKNRDGIKVLKNGTYVTNIKPTKFINKKGSTALIILGRSAFAKTAAI
jgi:hypothetical protein